MLRPEWDPVRASSPSYPTSGSSDRLIGDRHVGYDA